jgi:hypothetical protein
MVELQQTGEALASMPANNQLMAGVHMSGNLKAGVPGLSMGRIDFDPMKHSANDIDLGAPPSPTGDYQVMQVRPVHPLHINLVSTHMRAAEDPRITATKLEAQTQIKNALTWALPGVTDRAYQYSIGDNILGETSRQDQLIGIAEQDEAAASQQVADIARWGLTFVIGDLHRLQLPADQRFDHMVAIKVNHRTEREIPEGIGFFSLGGLVEVNTNKPKQLAKANDKLEAQHREIVERLEDRGVQVVSVIADPSIPEHFNAPVVDKDIAQALPANR